jgi:predicted Zn-dependent peptidase
MLVMNTLLGEGMSSRLFQNLRERHGLAYTVYSYTNTMSDTGNFGVYIGTDAKNIDRSIALIHKEFSKLKSTFVSRAELQRTKSQLKGTMMLSLESMSSRMMRLGSGEVYYGTFLPLDEIVKKIDAVDADSIREVAEKILRIENFSTVIFKPKASQTVSQ